MSISLPDKDHLKKLGVATARSVSSIRLDVHAGPDHSADPAVSFRFRRRPSDHGRHSLMTTPIGTPRRSPQDLELPPIVIDADGRKRGIRRRWVAPLLGVVAGVAVTLAVLAATTLL